MNPRCRVRRASANGRTTSSLSLWKRVRVRGLKQDFFLFSLRHVHKPYFYEEGNPFLDPLTPTLSRRERELKRRLADGC
jgi:hypothetical protein